MTINHALKEWDTACRRLAAGRQIVTFRKGGVSDDGGTFHLRYQQFALWPTFLHQKGELLRPEASDDFRPQDEEPSHVTVPCVAEVAAVHVVPNRAAAEKLAAEMTCWNSAYLDIRYGYKPDKPLYAVVLRARHLAEPARFEHTPEIAGCVSWIDLPQPVKVGRPVLGDDAFDRLALQVEQLIA
jgi:hypothetical protein